jgi:hypothetical protein
LGFLTKCVFCAPFAVVTIPAELTYEVLYEKEKLREKVKKKFTKKVQYYACN